MRSRLLHDELRPRSSLRAVLRNLQRAGCVSKRTMRVPAELLGQGMRQRWLRRRLRPMQCRDVPKRTVRRVFEWRRVLYGLGHAAKLRERQMADEQLSGFRSLCAGKLSGDLRRPHQDPNAAFGLLLSREGERKQQSVSVDQRWGQAPRHYACGWSGVGWQHRHGHLFYIGNSVALGVDDVRRLDGRRCCSAVQDQQPLSTGNPRAPLLQGSENR